MKSYWSVGLVVVVAGILMATPLRGPICGGILGGLPSKQARPGTATPVSWDDTEPKAAGPKLTRLQRYYQAQAQHQGELVTVNDLSVDGKAYDGQWVKMAVFVYKREPGRKPAVVVRDGKYHIFTVTCHVEDADWLDEIRHGELICVRGQVKSRWSGVTVEHAVFRLDSNKEKEDPPPSGK